MGDEDRPGGTGKRAWGYIRVPSWYEHALDQWRTQLEALAERQGFTIDQWYIDHSNRITSLMDMLRLLPGSGVEAIFSPHPSGFWMLEKMNGMDGAALAEDLRRPIYLLDPKDAPVAPPGQPVPTVVVPAPPRRRWLRTRPNGH